jgi:hypothetical protein
MTSQVAVYNMNGIAIASDTVVTSSSHAGSKTTSNSEKIYELGEEHKVLVMHYGGTTLNDVNHQFQFSEWALTLKEPLKTLSDYLDAYVKWTTVGKKFHSADSESERMRAVIAEHFEYLKRQIDQEYNSVAWDPEESEEARTASIIAMNKKHVQDGLEYLKSLELYEGMSEVTASEALKAAKLDLSKIIDEAFEGYYLNTGIKTLLKNSAIATLARAQDMEWDSYLAFVGYGVEDPFPGTIVLQCRSIYAGQLLCTKGNRSVIAPGKMNAEIERFAQGAAIQAFIFGYNADILSGVRWSVEKEINANFENASQKAAEIREKVADYIADHSWRTYRRPLLRHVAGMNMYGLAELARTLVSIQATFSESQDGPVSVGGLIEVVTIDRVNGVRWKQRLPR